MGDDYAEEVVDVDFAKTLERELAELTVENERHRDALARIEKWFGEFPPTGRTWPDGAPLSYGAAFGSNGERDYMRQVAAEALTGPEGTSSQARFPPEEPAGTSLSFSDEERDNLMAAVGHWYGLTDGNFGPPSSPYLDEKEPFTRPQLLALIHKLDVREEYEDIWQVTDPTRHRRG